MSARPGPALAALGLAAGYGSRTLWSGADFEVPEGSFTAVLGPNGSGKSTLVKLMLGLVAPRAGSLEVLGAAPRRGNSRIGYIPQSSVFDADFSVRGIDFVGLGLDGHRWGLPLPAGGGRQAAAVAAAIASVGAQAYAERRMGRLSGGEQQRLLLAQALVGEPDLLLMDEPLSHLDVRNQAAIIELLTVVRGRRPLTVLLIAHDVNPLLAHIDHVLYVAQGGMAMGTPATVINSETLSRIYSAPVEVLTDSRGRVFVVGLEEEVSHPHS